MYLALYRKYRPRTFDDVISQEHITTTLKNQVANNTAAHAYLFTGSRGTGKTTCAKILAMAVNCLNPQNGNPCLECERCREIMSGETTDIVEMDAASNNGVDDVRQLRDEVAYTPVSCKYRVYIIDEVHMLSAAAFNALLKTLEEPPPHVKFILATTELHKVPATISSRCQRFEFKRVDIAQSTERLLDVAAKENVSLDKDAAELISRLSDGGMRDALSLLDRCVSADEHITLQIVRDCAGVADNKHLFAFSEMVAKNDVAGCIRLLSELHKNSKDIAIVMDELSSHYRDLMLYKTAPGDTDLLSALPEDHPKLAENAELYDLANILRCLTLLQQCADNIGKTKQRKTLAEMCLVKMCTGVEAVTAAAPRVSAKPPQPTVIVQAPTPSEITPKSYEEMSERERLAAKRTKELVDRTVQKLKEVDEKNVSAQSAVTEGVPTTPSAVAESKPETFAPPEPPVAEESMPEPPAAEESMPEPPAPPWEEPPANDSFYDNEYPINSDVPGNNDTAPNTPEPPVEEPTADKDNSEQPPAEQSTAPSALNELSEERWKDVVSQMGFMYESFFTDSTAKLSDGVLEVRSSNPMLIKNVKNEELNDVEEMISKLLGFSVRLKIIAEKAPETNREEKNKLDKLLIKAQQLGIEVQNKNDQNGGQ